MQAAAIEGGDGHRPHQDDEANQFEEDYYSNFARRVYMIAEQESWDRATTMKYFNDRQAFEKFFTNVSGQGSSCSSAQLLLRARVILRSKPALLFGV